MGTVSKIFLVHGWTYSLDKWDACVDLLNKAGVEVVRLRVPGLTESSDKTYTIDDYVEWLRGELKNEKQPIVIAHSNGGRIALWYASKYKSHLRQLILIDSAGVAHAEKAYVARTTAIRLAAKILKPLRYIPFVRKAVYKVVGAHDYERAAPNMRETMKHMLASDKQLDLVEIETPTSLIWGSDDSMTPLTDGMHMAKIFKTQLHKVDGARHVPFFTHPAETSAYILEILDNTR